MFTTEFWIALHILILALWFFWYFNQRYSYNRQALIIMTVKDGISMKHEYNNVTEIMYWGKIIIVSQGTKQNMLERKYVVSISAD